MSSIEIIKKKRKKSIYQWDLDRKIKIILPEASEVNEVHFSHPQDTEALVVRTKSEAGEITADIPNILLQSDQKIKVWLVSNDHTICNDVITVIKKAKPADYVYTETEVLRYENLEKRIETLEKNSSDGAPDAVQYVEQNLTTEQQSQARINIGAADAERVRKLSERINELEDKTESTEKIELVDMTSYLLKSGGNVVATSSTNENRIVSEPVYANEGETYLFTCSANYGNALYVIYDMTGESIGQVVADATVDGNVLTEQQVTMPEGTYYFRLACNKDILVDGYSAYKVIGKSDTNILLSPLKGKKWVVLGDSITEKNIRTSKNYHDYITEETGIKVVNMGAGGTGYKNGEEENIAFYQRAADIPEDADIITIFGSGNDRNLELGSVTDTDTNTVCGCINTTIDTIHQLVPTAWLGIITPTPWMNFPPYEAENKIAKISQALAEICERRGIPCLDLYHCSGLRPWDEEFRKLAYSKDDGDGTHPDETGHAMIYPQIRSFLLGSANNANAMAIRKLSGEITDYIVQDYVKVEAEEVADKVLESRNAYSFVFGATSDLHTTGTDASATGAIHVGQALAIIQSLTQLDLVANFGDVMVGYFDETYKDGFKCVKKAFHEITKTVPYVQMQGNHDQLSTDTTAEAQQKYFAHIGANNVNTVTDYENRYRNYGYKDFTDQKIRFIYLNSADVSEVEVTDDCHISAEQFNWFINIALNFEDKSDGEQWYIIVGCHHPLNWYGTGMSNLLTLLNAYKGGASGSIIADSTTIPYDFTSATRPTFIAHFHGHLHNFRTETLGSNSVLTITIPNACYDRNNEYGTSISYDDTVHANYGDTDSYGNQRQYNKSSGTAEDTAFNVVVVDIENKVIHAYCHGSGIDRTINFTGNVVEPDEPIEPDTPSYTNQIPLSVDAYGNDYVGTNGEDGYKTGTRLSSSTGAESTSGTGVADYEITGFIPIEEGDELYFYNMEINSNPFCGMALYQEDKSFITYNTYSDMVDVYGANTDGTNITHLKCSGNSNFTNAKWIRFCGYEINDTSIIRVFTNQIPLSIKPDGAEFVGDNGEDGYRVGYRLSTSSGAESSASGMSVTGFMPLGTAPNIVRVKDIDLTDGNSTYGIYNNDFTKDSTGYCNSTFSEIDENGVRVFEVNRDNGYIRISGAFGENPIVTINEEIV